MAGQLGDLLVTIRRACALGLTSSAVLLTACQRVPARGPLDLRGVLLPQPVAKAEFTLESTSGTPFSFRKETDGFVTLLFFGYTNCPDACPIHMANIAAVLAKLPPAVSNQIKVVMVTTDPHRDDAVRLRSWLDTFDRSFIGLIGPLDVVNDIQRSLSIPPAMRMDTDDDYAVGHASQVMVFTSDDRAHVVYPYGTRQEDWAHDLPLLVRSSWDTR